MNNITNIPIEQYAWYAGALVLVLSLFLVMVLAQFGSTGDILMSVSPVPSWPRSLRPHNISICVT